MQVYSSSPDFTSLFFITEFTKLQIIRRFWGRSILQLEMPIESEAVSFLQKNCWIVDDKDEPFIIRSITQNETTVTVVAYGCHWGFEGRITTPNAGSYAIEKTGSADQVAKGFINDTLTKTNKNLNITVADGRPVAPNEAPISDQSRYKNLGDEVVRVLKNAGLGERFTYEDRIITFDTYPGADNSNMCVFDVRYKNIEKYEYTLDATSTQTTPIVGGMGDGVAREIYIEEDSDNVLGWDRREVFVDARDIIDTAIEDREKKLQQRATQAIISEEKKYSTTVATNANLTYNEDYHLGDFVSINVPIKTYEDINGFLEPTTKVTKLKTRIIEVIETCDEGVETIELTFGDDVIKSDTTQLKSDVAQLKSVESAFPAGFVMLYAGSTAPFGYLLANGQSVSRTTYSSLFSAIGTTYGANDGSTFKLPDLRGKVSVGLSSVDSEFNTLGKTGGAKSVILDTTMIPNHRHQQAIGSWDDGNWTHAPAQNPPADGPGTYWTGSYTDYTGGGLAHNNLQPYITLNYIIKY